MEVVYTKRADKEIKSMNEPMRGRILAGIERLPDGDVKRLEGYNNYYRLRIGDYRIIFEWVDINSIVVLSAASRGQVYRRY